MEEASIDSDEPVWIQYLFKHMKQRTKAYGSHNKQTFTLHQVTKTSIDITITLYNVVIEHYNMLNNMFI